MDQSQSIGASVAGTLKQLLAIVRRRMLLFWTVLLLSCGLGAAYYFFKAPIYQAKASVLVHRTGDAQSPKDHDSASGRQDLLPTHMRLMTSAAVLDKALVTLRSTGMAARVPESAEVLAENLKVSAQPGTEIVDLSYEATDAQFAAAVVSAVVASYIEFVNDSQRSSSKEILQSLAQQKETLDRQLQAKEAQLMELRKSAGILTLKDDKSTVQAAQVAALGEALTKARTRRMEMQAAYRAVKVALSRGEPVEGYLLRHFDRLGPDVLATSLGLKNNTSSPHDALCTELLANQMELERLEPTYGPSHPKVKKLGERIAIISQILAQEPPKAPSRDELQSLVLRLFDHDLVEAQGLERDLQEQFDKEQTRALELNGRYAEVLALEAEVKRLHGSYDTLADRIKQVNLTEDYSAIITQIIEPPVAPEKATSPNPEKIGLVCATLGIIFGLGVCFFLECWDNSYRGPDDIAAHLGLPVLGQIPQVRRRRKVPFELITNHAPKSAAAEAFRTLRSALTLCDSPPKKFAVTSPDPADGKTSVAVNLAVAFAQSGLRTLLVDGDMRRPRLQEFFDLPDAWGLSFLLQRRELAEQIVLEALQRTPVDRLHVLPGGAIPANPTELLAGHNLEKLLTCAEERYDRIVFDAPPVLAVSDCAILSRLLDGVLLVVPMNRSKRMSAVRACNALRTMNCSVLGVVANRTIANSAYGYGYYGRGTRAAHMPQPYPDRRQTLQEDRLSPESQPASVKSVIVVERGAEESAGAAKC